MLLAILCLGYLVYLIVTLNTSRVPDEESARMLQRQRFGDGHDYAVPSHAANYGYEPRQRLSQYGSNARSGGNQMDSQRSNQALNRQ